MDVLGASATKREAKSYLSRFEKSKSRSAGDPVKERFHAANRTSSRDNGVNLGGLYPVRSIDESPVFSQGPQNKPFVDPSTEPVHAALIVMRTPGLDDDLTLQGVARTLSQLSQLGLHCIVVTDSGSGNSDLEGMALDRSWRSKVLADADRLVAAIEQNPNQRGRRLDGIVSQGDHNPQIPVSTKVRSRASLINTKMLYTCLQSGAICVIPPVGITANQVLVPVDIGEIILALTRSFQGLDALSSGSPNAEQEKRIDIKDLVNAPRKVSLDRIIVLDSCGGIPSAGPAKEAHVFINLEQEYDEIQKELTGSYTEELNGSPKTPPLYSHNEGIPSSEGQRHLANLRLARDALKLLPPSSSALITSPQAVARSEHKSTPSTPGVGTRPQRNILIHNLLTDKPVYSSSLPTSRLASLSTSLESSPRNNPTTFLTRGMPLTIIPDPKRHPWIPPADHKVFASLSDPGLDIPRLVHLIEDSFGRPLNQQHYFTRIQPILAGIIIAGAYEGGAILTWEKPPSAPSNDSSRLVPYLDKFAVLKRSQGAGGVADIVFSAMVRDCFPQGVCWRSRSDNPINRWYFERAIGTRRLDGGRGSKSTGQSWTMFWTTEQISKQRFADYEEVCRSIGTSWADGGKRLD